MDFSLLDSIYRKKSDENDIYEIIAKELGLTFLEKGFFKKELHFPVETKQINELFPFSGILDIQEKLFSIQPGEVLFLDIEASGVNFQTTNYPFLAGFGFYKQEEYHIHQYFLLETSLEDKLLTVVRDYVEDFPYIATFNGKKFDIPYLQSRFQLYGEIFPSHFHHFDVYHIWKRLLPKNFHGGYSQKNLENKILAVERDNDIEGYRIPEIIFDWMKYKRHEEFHRVFRHNEWDVLYLFHLFLRALEVIKNQDGATDDRIPLAKVFFRNKFYDEVIKIIEEDIRKRKSSTDHYRLLYQAYLKKRDYEKAAGILKHLVEGEKNPKEMLLLIRILQKLFRYREAYEYVQDMIELYSTSPEKFHSGITLQYLQRKREKLHTLL